MMMKKENKSTKRAATTGALAALAASSCCIPPVIGAIAGVGGIGSALSWMEPLRPYMISLAIVAIAYAWYVHLRPRKTDDCGCESNDKPKWHQTKGFLTGITLFAFLSAGFPYYAHIFYPSAPRDVMIVESSNVRQAKFNVTGMTCQSCAEHIEHALSQLPGLLSAEASYEQGTAIVQFDKSKVSVRDIIAAIDHTGYEAALSEDEKPHQ